MEEVNEQDLKDKIATEVKDCVTTYLCNYTHVKVNTSDWIPIHKIINELDEQIESILLKIGCEKEEARREKLRSILVQIEAQKVDKLRILLEIAVKGLIRCSDRRMMANGLNRIAELTLREIEAKNE